MKNKWLTFLMFLSMILTISCTKDYNALFKERVAELNKEGKDVYKRQLVSIAESLGNHRHNHRNLAGCSVDSELRMSIALLIDVREENLVGCLVQNLSLIHICIDLLQEAVCMSPLIHQVEHVADVHTNAASQTLVEVDVRAEAVPVAVSYTHLDVYKRQHQGHDIFR